MLGLRDASDQRIRIAGILCAGKQAEAARQLFLNTGRKELGLFAGTLGKRRDIDHRPARFGSGKKRRQIFVVHDEQRGFALNLRVGEREFALGDFDGKFRVLVKDVGIILQPLLRCAFLGIDIDELALERTGDDDASAGMLVEALFDIGLAGESLLFGGRFFLKIKGGSIGDGVRHGRQDRTGDETKQ